MLETAEARRPRGRPPGWRAIPPPTLADEVRIARRRLRLAGLQPTWRAIAAAVYLPERSLRRYRRERPADFA